MHIYSYTDTVNGYKAFDVAYQDVLEAFKYFINKNPSNPIIIAAHSQGTNHAVRLINEYISLNKNISALDPRPASAPLPQFPQKAEINQ